MNLKMSKSVYSLVLSDEVVREVDKMAYTLNTNRSGMINEILARYLSVVTPENRIRQIIRSLENEMLKSTSFKILPASTDATFVVKSALSYKYNPVIKYSVALYKNNKNHFGSIKAGIRTQNESLISIMNDFFVMYYKIERKYIDFPDNNFHELSLGKLTRNFKVGTDDRIDDNRMGLAISSYIDNLDKMIKYYFSEIENPRLFTNLEIIYEDYLKKADIVL